MTFDDLGWLFINWGWYVKPQHYEQFENYLKFMLHRKRVIIIEKDGLIEGILMFFLTNDYEKLYKKGLWDTPMDEDNGRQIYIDKLVCRKVTLALRRKIQETIEANFPEVLEGYYHRAPYDRCVRIWRKGTKNAKLQDTFSG